MLDDLKRYRTPVMLGAAGIVGLAAFQRAQQARAAAIAAPAPAVTVPGAAADPNALAASLAQGFGLGGGAVLSGVNAVAAPAFGLAQMATLAATTVAGDVVGLAGLLGGVLGNVVTDVTGVLQPVALPVTQPPPPPTNGTTTPPPTTEPAATWDGTYWASTTAGPSLLFTVAQSGAITNQRQVQLSGGRVGVRRSTSATMHWRIQSGGFDGWSLIPGRSAAFGISKRMRRPDGTTYFLAVSPATGN